MIASVCLAISAEDQKAYIPPTSGIRTARLTSD